MPTYEYACVSCGTHVDVFQRFNEESLTVCGVCGGLLRKVFHPAGILFKGSGFYATDSRSSRAGASSRDGQQDGGENRGEKGAEKSGEKGAEKVESGSKGEQRKPSATPRKEGSSKNRSAASRQSEKEKSA